MVTQWQISLAEFSVSDAFQLHSVIELFISEKEPVHKKSNIFRVTFDDI